MGIRQVGYFFSAGYVGYKNARHGKGDSSLEAIDSGGGRDGGMDRRKEPHGNWNDAMAGTVF